MPWPAGRHVNELAMVSPAKQPPLRGIKLILKVLPLANSPGGHRLGVNSLAFDGDNSILYATIPMTSGL